MAVTLYRQLGKGKARRYQKVNLGPGRRPTNLTGPYFLRYSLANGTRPWEPVGDDLDAAIVAQKRKQAYFEALDANVPVVQDQDESGHTKITDAVFQWFAELQIFQGKDQQGKSKKTLQAYNYRLGFFLDFTSRDSNRARGPGLPRPRFPSVHVGSPSRSSTGSSPDASARPFATRSRKQCVR